jgi:DnaJ-class molecular chaperone
MSINTTMKKTNNPWFILGLEPGASQKQVKLAYKRLALKNHPDKGGTIADWLAISDAYEEIQKKNHVPIVKSIDVQMVDLALTIEQQITGVNDYIKIDEEEDLYLKVNIPAGVLAGDKFKITDKRKKYIINVKEKANKVFTRSGNNIIMYKTLDVIDVMKLNSFMIITPTGERCEIDIPSDTVTGSIIVLKGHGLYNRKSKRKGNLRIHIKVKIPYLNSTNMEEFITRLRKND